MIGLFKKNRSMDDDLNRCHNLIAPGTVIKGDVQFSGTLRVEGRIDGKVSLVPGTRGNLVLTRGGTVNGPVSATNVLTDGLISGTLRAKGRVECRNKAIIRGDVYYDKIHIAEGATIEGRCIQKGDEKHPHTADEIRKEQPTKDEPTPATMPKMDFLKKDALKK